MKYTTNYRVRRISMAEGGPVISNTSPTVDKRKLLFDSEDKYSKMVKSTSGYYPLKDNSIFTIKDLEGNKPGIRNGTKINKQVLADLASAAAKEGVPLITALTTAMRETGVGGVRSANVYDYNKDNQPIKYNPQQVMQAWNANNVNGIPLDYDHFRIKNNLVSPDRVVKDKMGTYVKDTSIDERTKYADKYAEYINSFKTDPTLKEPFRKEMRFLKNNSGTKYNSNETKRTTRLARDESVIRNNTDVYQYADSVYKANSNNKTTMINTNGKYGAVPRKDWGGTLTGASTGFQMGSSIGSNFGPIGAGIGAGVGILAGAIFGNKSENKKFKEQKARDAQIKLATDKAKEASDALYKKGVRANDTAQLASISMNNASSLFMSKGGSMIKPSHKGRFTAYKKRTGKTTTEALHSNNEHVRQMAQFAVNAKKFHHAMGGAIGATGVNLSDGNKLLTKNGSTSGSHETGQNIPIKKNNKTIAVAEPGEVLVNDKSISKVPFILSKRLGFAQDFMNLENMKTSANERDIEVKQAKIVNMNNKVAPNSRKASWGVDLMAKVDTSKLALSNKNIGIQKYTGTPGKKSKAGNIFGDIYNFVDQNSKIDPSTIVGAAGTLGNLLSSNKVLKYQKGLIQDSLNQTLAYQPKLNKNYLMDENVDVNNQVSAVNQGYASAVSGLEGVDAITKSALKNTASLNRNSSLSNIYGERNRLVTGTRNQNTSNIMQNNANNTSIINQSNLSKLNARISANEAFGDASAAGLANNQGAVTEFNTILRDREMMDSLKSRWKDSIGDSFIKSRGGKIMTKKKMMMPKNLMMAR